MLDTTNITVVPIDLGDEDRRDIWYESWDAVTGEQLAVQTTREGALQRGAIERETRNSLKVAVAQANVMDHMLKQIFNL